MRLRTILIVTTVLAVSFAGATVGMQWLAPAAPPPAVRPALADVPPLPPTTRTSTVVVPVSISLSAIRDAMEREAPRDFSGRRDTPLNQFLSKAEITWTATRGPLTLTGGADALAASTPVNGALRATGQISQQAAGNVGNMLSGFLGQDIGRSIERLAAGRTFDQRGDIRGNVTLTAHPALTPAWRIEPNMSAQVSLADAGMSIAGVRLNVAQEVRPHLERMLNEQIAALQARLRDDPQLERVARREWANLCRAIPLGAAGSGLPNLWLEMRPARAFAAQPHIDASSLVLTLGVQAETRIVPEQTTPDCPFPANLELVPQAEQGHVSLAVPIDVPFSEINRLIEARLTGKTVTPAQGVAIKINSVTVVPSGDRLLISLRIKADENKTWFGLGGTEATVYVWGRPLLDREQQVLRLGDVSLAVESEAALVGTTARAAQSYLEKVLAEQAVIDLKPFAANARARAEAAIADFRTNNDGLRIDASVTDLRLVDLAFDAQTLRVFAEANGTATVAVTALPEK